MNLVRSPRAILAICALLNASIGCSPPAGTASVPTQVTTAAPPSAASTPLTSIAPSATAAEIQSDVVGEWVRTQSCEEALAAFKAEGLDDLVADMVVGNWVGEGASFEPGRECDDARPPEEHSHFFTADGEFGSRDDVGERVDFGDYLLIDEDTLSFPSHAEEFGYDGQVLVDFAIEGSTATFTRRVPGTCEDACRVAHGWALAAFYEAAPWERAD